MVLLMLLASGGLSAQKAELTLEQVMARVGQYVASYGEKAAVVVATEKYSQTMMVDGVDKIPRPLQLEAEFAIVRVSGGGWSGFRDVVEVDGKPVHDRRDRLVALLTNTAGDASEVTRIANESARYNVGPVSRNFNVPTAGMFFFYPDDHVRFTFTRKGTKKIEGIETWEIAFKETRSPSLIRTRAGKDVPIEGALWVKPEDGTVVRTRFKMRNFADQPNSVDAGMPQQRGPTNPSSNSGASIGSKVGSLHIDKLESEADIEVTYTAPPGLGIWFPASMVELYVGPIPTRTGPIQARATTRAKYSDFRQFNTSIKIVQ
jgi:hypothetical protein